MDVSINLLGRFRVTVANAPVDPAEWRRRQAAALVKILALAPGRRLHREQVMDQLWPELDVDDAAPRLHKAAHYARRALTDPKSVVLAGESVALFPGEPVRIDAAEFQSLAEDASARQDRDAAGRAADSYGGDLLPDDRYEVWAEDARDRFRLLYLDMLRLSGRWEVLSRVDPTDEEAHLNVIAELAGQGNLRSALRQFERLERAMRQELGVGPGPAAVALRARLQHEEAAQLAEMPPDTTLDRTPGQPQLPLLVGGVADRARLQRLLDTVSAGQGQTLFVSGSAGIGKTALLAWLEHTAAARGVRVGSGVAAQIEGAWPYAPVLEALADLCRRHPALLDGLDDSLRTEIERGLVGREIEWTAQSGHQRLFVAAAELLRLAAAGPGAVLVVDDAHHADNASLRLLHYLARSTVSERVLLVLAHRPPAGAQLADVRQSLLGRGTGVLHEVSPLTYAEVSALTRRLEPAVTDEFVDAIWTASEGVPFAVVELARSGTQPTTLSRAPFLPALTDRQAHAFAAAAVLGATFDTDEFLQTTSLDEQDGYRVLDDGVVLRLLVRTETGYAFRHPMLRDALLEGLPASQLRDLHRQAAAALEELDRSPAQIGHHLVQAGNQTAAVTWLLRAAETSAALGAYPEALATLDAVRSQARGEQLGRLLSLRADLLLAAADVGAVDAYREALAVTTDAAVRASLRARLARASAFAGDLETASIALDGLLTDGSSRDTELLLARGTLALFQGDLDAAEQAASEARRRVTLGRPDEHTFELITLQGLVAHNRGQWFQRLRSELRSGAGRPALAAVIFDSHLCVAEFLLYGPTPYQEVLKLAAELRDTAERSGVLRAVAFATALRGETALLMGDLELAGSELQDAVDLHRDIGSGAGEAHSLQRLAEVKLARGERGEANRLLRQALRLARFTSVAQHLIQRIYGTRIAAAGDPVAARAIVDQAEAAMGVADRCVFCEIMLAVPAAGASIDVGDIESAQRYLQVAETSARMWEGTAWQASILELRGHLAQALGDPTSARQLRYTAAEMFDTAGQPLDSARCRSLASSAAGGRSPSGALT